MFSSTPASSSAAAAGEQFRVVVEVHDVQGLIYPSPTLADRAAARAGIKRTGKLPNPFVDVLVGGNTQSTNVHEKTATCSFNRMFVFTGVSIDESIDVRVCHKTLFYHELIGSYFTSLREVRQLPHNRLLQTLCPIVIRECPSEPRGFVRLTLSVLKPGEAVDTSDTDAAVGGAAGAGRILHTPELDFECYNLNINVYIGFDILKTVSAPGSTAPTTYVKVVYGGTELATSKQQLTRSPVWNETLRFPASVPCSSDRIEVELWEEHDRISFAFLSFQQILKSERKPSWMNLYSVNQPRRQKQKRIGALAAFAALFEFDDEDVEGDSLSEVFYLGRILIGANCVKHKTPPPAQSFPARPVEVPATQECVLWANLLDISGLKRIKDIMVEVAFGDWLASATADVTAGDVASFAGNKGAIPEHLLMLPSQLDSCFDVIIRIYGRLQEDKEFSPDRKFVAYVRLTVSELMKKSVDPPEWIPLQRSESALPFTTGVSPAYILAGVTIQKTSTVRARNMVRPPIPKFTLELYKFDALFYQAVHLPVHRAAMPNPYVLATLGGTSVATRTVNSTTHPDWNEMLSFECALPSPLTLSRDPVIQVISGRMILGELTLPMGYIAGKEASKLQWYPLVSQRFPLSAAKVLCCFRLVSAGSPEEGQVFPDPAFKPQYCPFDLSLFVVGVRMFSSITPGRSPDLTPCSLQLEFGRDPADLNTRLWTSPSDVAVNGSGGNYNFLNPYDVECFLPANELLQSYMDIKVFSNTDDGQTVTDIGTAYLHLTPLQPRISRRHIEALFRDFGSFYPNLDEIIAPPFFASSHRPPFLQSLDRFAASKTREDGERDDRAFEDSLDETLEDSNATAAAAAAEDSWKKTRMLADVTDANFFMSAEDTFLGRETELLRSAVNKCAFYEGVSKFDWGISGSELEKQEELRKPLENELNPADMPYVTVPIIGPSRQTDVAGVPEVLGIVKIRCKILDAEIDKTEDQTQMELLQSSIRLCPKLKVRVHVLSASGLIPPIGKSADVETTEWFLIISNNKSAEEKKGCHAIRDSRFRGKGFSPDFYRSFELDCDLPGDSLLSLGIASESTVWSSEEFLGHTLIDLENRWFHPSYLNFQDQLPPIEMRALRAPWREDVVGTIRCWLEILTVEDALNKPMVPASLPQLERVQVRIVVWQIRNIPVQETGLMSLYVVGFMAGAEGDLTQQETDTHWNSADGRGLFNWRFVFDVTVPGEASQLRLQVWNRNLLSAHEAVAETVLELSADLEKCRSTKDAVMLDRTWIKLYHPQAPTQVMGLLELELCLLSATEAADDPVGLGRKEPNRNPYLAEVVENRNFIASTALATGFFAASEKVAMGAKIGSWTVGIIVFASVVYMFRKVFLS